MKQLITLILVTTAFFPAAAAPCGKHEPVLREAKVVTWPDLYRRGDTEGLARFLAADFVSIGPDGTVSTAAQEIAWLKEHPWQPQEFRYTITRIDCPTTHVAVIVGAGRSVQTNENGHKIVHGYSSSNVFVLDGVSWRAVVSHVSGESSKPE